MLARAVALLRNERGIGTDHWTSLEPKALSDVAIANLAVIVRQIDVRLTVPRCSASSTLSVCCPSQGGAEKQTVLQSLLHFCGAAAMMKSTREWDAARARFWESAFKGRGALRLDIRRRLLQKVGVNLGETTASVWWDMQTFHDSISCEAFAQTGDGVRFSPRGWLL